MENTELKELVSLVKQYAAETPPELDIPKEKEDEFASEFWDKPEDLVKVMGDLCNRPQLEKLIGEVSGLNVADLGCGTGFMSRKLAKLDAKVFGCDVSVTSLIAALKRQIHDESDISYLNADVTALPYANGSMDKAVSCSVFPYMPAEEVKKSLREARRVLKKGGELAIGMLHPDLIANPPEGMKWMWYEDLSRPIQENDALKQHYIDIDGNESVVTNYYHSVEFYEQALREAGFEIVMVQEPVVTEEMIKKSPYWGTACNHKAMYQVLARAV